MSEAISITVSQLRRNNALRDGAVGELRWQASSGKPLVVQFQTSLIARDLCMSLHYRLGANEYDQSVFFESDPSNADHWWMICPVPTCRRRVAKLFLPNDADQFACPTCHGISKVWLSEST